MGSIEKTIIVQCQRRGVPLPERIQNAPELELGLDFFYVAFTYLSTCRNGGFGIMPIPYTAVMEYGTFHKLNDEEIQELLFLITKMDTAFMKHVNSKQEKK